MSGAEHSEGPWGLRRDAIIGDVGEPIAHVCEDDGQVWYCDLEGDAARANARLMAAAPDLLAALEGVALRNGEDGPCFCAARAAPHHLSCLRARAAIAKAKGGAP